MTSFDNLAAAYEAVSEKVLTETLRLKAGESLTIESWTGGLPLAREISLRAKKMGAIPLTTYEDEKSYVDGVRGGDKAALGKMGKHEYSLLASTDAFIFIPGPPIGGYYPKITRQEFIDSTSYNGSWYDAAKKAGLRGARLTAGYVGNDVARLLGKDRDDIILHQLNAASADFGKIRAKAKRLSKLLADGTDVEVITDGGKLVMKLKGEVEIQDGLTDKEDVAGGENMSYVPPGYVGKGVDAASVDGSFSLERSTTRFGMVEDAKLRFRRGKFAEWTSRKSPKVMKSLEAVLPEKSRLPTFLMIGLNPLMKFGYGQDRFPEGSVSLAVGFTGTIRKGTLKVGGETIVKEGRLV